MAKGNIKDMQSETVTLTDKPPDGTTRSTSQKVALFRRFFTGLNNVYGTYDPRSGRVRQIKAPVTDQVILAHLTGQQSYGVYLLVKDRTRAIASDFDQEDLQPPMDFVAAAGHYGIPAYLERSKSKGYHAWIFFEEQGVIASKARLVVRHILEEIGHPHTEVFPKQDSLAGRVSYGNFINAPLQASRVPQGRTVFVDSANPTKPHPDQWDFLESVRRISESVLDEVIEINELNRPASPPQHPGPIESGRGRIALGLPPCAQRMLTEGVTSFQRVFCFRLAVHFKRVGLPYDIAVAALDAWARKNNPAGDKSIISKYEIRAQASAAYEKDYRSYGCEDAAIAAYCDKRCPLRRMRS